MKIVINTTHKTQRFCFAPIEGFSNNGSPYYKAEDEILMEVTKRIPAYVDILRHGSRFFEFYFEIQTQNTSTDYVPALHAAVESLMKVCDEFALVHVSTEV